MKKFILIFLCVVSSLSIKAEGSEKNDWNILIESIIEKESNGNPKAVNKRGNCVGILQITPILVRDCNRILGEKKYSYQDRLNRNKSIEMFNIIQNYYNKEKNIEKAIRLWNGGANYSKWKTEEYYQKVMKIYRRRLNESK